MYPYHKLHAMAPFQIYVLIAEKAQETTFIF